MIRAQRSMVLSILGFLSAFGLIPNSFAIDLKIPSKKDLIQGKRSVVKQATGESPSVQGSTVAAPTTGPLVLFMVGPRSAPSEKCVGGFFVQWAGSPSHPIPNAEENLTVSVAAEGGGADVYRDAQCEELLRYVELPRGARASQKFYFKGAGPQVHLLKATSRRHDSEPMKIEVK